MSRSRRTAIRAAGPVGAALGVVLALTGCSGGGVDVDVRAPSVDVPDVKLPSVDVPDVKLPSVDVPDVRLPSVDVPSVNVPDVDASDLPDVDVSAGADRRGDGQ